MAGEAHDSAAILASARQSLRHQRAGGRRRGSIGRRSAELKRRHLAREAARVALAIGAVMLATMIAGLILVAAGFLRLGTYIKFIPYPVTVGFTAGIAVGAEGRPGIGAMGVDRLAEAPRFELEEVRAVGGDVLHRWRRGGAASR